MERLTTTPFGQRPLKLCLIEGKQDITQRTEAVDKWEVFRALRIARSKFGLSHQTLSVLNALLTFHPGRALSAEDLLVVFPSNRSLSERACGMPESTLRRHLAALVSRGLIQRHDSPNGKRFARRDHTGALSRAFGFDLAPLLSLADTIGKLARAEETTEKLRKELREEIILQNRDAEKYIELGEKTLPTISWEDLKKASLHIKRCLRRKLALSDLESLKQTSRDLLQTVRSIVLKACQLSGKDSQSERHHQSSNTKQTASPISEPDMEPQSNIIPLDTVLTACPEIGAYAKGGITNWHELLGAAEFLHSLMGVPKRSWQHACNVLGDRNAAITLAAMLQNSQGIKSPGAYLNTLTRKAEKKHFTPEPMINALLTRTLS